MWIESGSSADRPLVHDYKKEEFTIKEILCDWKPTKNLNQRSWQVPYFPK